MGERGGKVCFDDMEGMRGSELRVGGLGGGGRGEGYEKV